MANSTSATVTPTTCVQWRNSTTSSTAVTVKATVPAASRRTMRSPAPSAPAAGPGLDAFWSGGAHSDVPCTSSASPSRAASAS